MNPSPGPLPLPPPPLPSGSAPAPEQRRRADRRGDDRRKQQVPVAVERRTGIDRRAVDRRAQQGKTAGGYDLDAETLEFIHAVNQFKEASGKPFPTWSEILQIVRSLGYVRPAP